ncbi:MAG: phage major capsid protein [Patescibacteria group bacterium]|nr:phage major capsid protein [Patescibacteria group bacterium]
MPDKLPSELSPQELHFERNSLIKKTRDIWSVAEERSKKAGISAVQMTGEERQEFERVYGGKDTEGKEFRGRLAELDDEVEVRRRANTEIANDAALHHRMVQTLAREDVNSGRTESAWITNPLADSSGRVETRAQQPKWIIGENGRRTFTTPQDRRDFYGSDEYRRNFQRYGVGGTREFSNEELRALQMDFDTQGGFMVAPQQFVNDLVIFVKNLVYVRNLATVHTCENAESLGMPSLEGDVSDPNWTAEIQTGVEDTSMTFGKRELRPHPVAKLIRVSDKLLRASSMNVEALIRDRLAYKVSVVEEAAFMTGLGVDQPLGVFTASNMGIDTSRDVVGANTSTSIAADALISCFYNLKYQYQISPKIRWIFHRTTIQNIRQLKDGIGQYLWQPGVTGGAQLSEGSPDTVYGRPYIMSEYAPNTYTASQYVGIIGDFSFYHIADALAMRIQRLAELYAATAQVGFILRKETDGMPVLSQAFSRLQLHS